MANNSSPSDGDMKFSVELDDYDDADVVAFGTTIHKLGRFKGLVEKMRQSSLFQHLGNEFKSALDVAFFPWLEPGADCEILKASGKGWKKGKLKFELTVKFYPDEPEIEEVKQAEPSLDSMRLTMDKLR